VASEDLLPDGERIDGGFVLLARRLKKSALWKVLHKRPDFAILFLELLLSASYNGGEIVVDGNRISIPRGSLWTSLDRLSRETGLSVRNIRTAFEQFRKVQFLAYRGDKRGRIVSLVNYQTYQDGDAYGDKGKRQTGDKRVTRLKKDEAKQLEEAGADEGVADEAAELLRGLEFYEADAVLRQRLPKVLSSWKAAHPGLDLRHEVAKAHAWEIEHPEKAKKNRIAFLGTWLRKAENGNGRTSSGSTSPPKEPAGYIKGLWPERTP
jgi:hypothetical protein